jgi:uncharacterized protein (TIGR02246 family)
MNADEKSIAPVLLDYEGALNRSDTAAVMKLYAPDGAFMPQDFPSSVGTDAVRKAYDGVFRAITLSVKFAIAEIKQVGPDWAFARTNSVGKVKVNATGQSSPEANQELFVFQKVGTTGRSLVIVFRPLTRRVHKVKAEIRNGNSNDEGCCYSHRGWTRRSQD